MTIVFDLVQEYKSSISFLHAWPKHLHDLWIEILRGCEKIVLSSGKLIFIHVPTVT